MADPHGKTPGLTARRAAAAVLSRVFDDRQPLEQAFAVVADSMLARTSASDRAFARALATTVMRRRGQIDDAIDRYLAKPLPRRSGSTRRLIAVAVAELLFLDAKPHAAVDCAVALAGEDPAARHFKGLVNAVLRRVAETKAELLAVADATRLNTPDWLWRRWTATYGPERARAIAAAHLVEPPLDLTLKDPVQAPLYAERLDAVELPTGSLRRRGHGRLENLPGFAEGDWWVQDAAAALPARLLGEVKGRTVFDLCAAPGGKTAQLAVRGARVSAVDKSPTRLALVEASLRRLGLQAQLVTADAAEWRPGTAADAILLDAPCSATGTLRRHPDVAHLKRDSDIESLSRLQESLLDHAAELVRPGGLLVFSTCSLENEEGPEVIARFLGRRMDFARWPVNATEVGECREFLTADGDLRTLPCHWPQWGGLDGFFAARLRRA